MFVAGVEDGQGLAYWAAEKDALVEARRVLYVAMARARDRLYLVSVEQRRGKPSRRSRNLDGVIGTCVQSTYMP